MDAVIRPRRSLLYMPGSNARALDKARGLPVDGIIIDLEDAVAPEAKAEARSRVVQAVQAGGFGPREVVVRINGLDTPWGHDDMAAVAQARPDAVLLPKVASPETLRVAGGMLRAAGAPESVRVWAMIETPLAVLSVREIAACALDPSMRLACLVMGTNDLVKETRSRVAPGRWPLLPLLGLSIAGARAYGLDILDGVYNELKDEAGFRAECEQGRDLGFDGKTLVHPGQIEAANAIFAPSAEETAGAQEIIAAFERPENAGRGVIQLGGRMVERMHADMARRTVALGQAIGARVAG